MVQVFHQQSQAYAEHNAKHGRQDSVPQGFGAYRAFRYYRLLIDVGRQLAACRASFGDQLGGHLADRVDDLRGLHRVVTFVGEDYETRALDLLDGQVIQEVGRGQSILQFQALDGLFGYGAAIYGMYHRQDNRLESLDSSSQVRL